MDSFFGRDLPSLTLRKKKDFASTCDASTIQPAMIESMTLSEIGAMKLPTDSTSVRLDELFEVIGDPCPHLVLDGDCSALSRLGAGMDRGTILVKGSVGDALASQMRGGRIEVLGDCGDDLAVQMRGGAVIVHGSAGDRVAGPLVGQRRGMQGGDCLILGNVGSRAAERMRRGTLFIGGTAGDFGAAQMIAGTVIAMGEIGVSWAGGMRRGSIILAKPATQEFAAELTPPREFELSFLPLLWRHLQSLLGKNRVPIPSTRWAKRQLGDRANQGMGEVLSLTRPSQP